MPDPSAPSVTKFNGVRDVFASLVGLETSDVYPVYVSKPGNTRVRFEQSGADDNASLGIAVLKDADDADASASAAERILQGDGAMEAIAFVGELPEHGWDVVEILHAPGSTIGTDLASLFPDALTILSGVEEAGTRSLSWLEERLSQFIEEEKYPTEKDGHHQAIREDFTDLLSTTSLESPEVFDLDLFRKLLVGNYGGPGPQSNLNRFLKNEGDAGVERLTRSLRHLLYGGGEVADRLDDVLGDPQWSVPGLGESVATKCLAIVDPDRWIPLFVYWSGTGGGKQDILRVLGLQEPEESTPGQTAVTSNDLLREVVEPLLPGDPWGQMRFLWWLKDRGTDAGVLAKELFLPRKWIEEVAALLDHKGQVVFYGPPGTGKTFVARKFARWFADKGRVETIQFHPSFAYEDFVQGYRPLEAEGDSESSIKFKLIDGPLLRLARHARDSGEVCVLIIDEINRGNVAKLFGELYYLLEYRDEEIELQYGERFSLPENLLVVGTMNTADRSIALVDAALRRRFHFVPFFPDQYPIEGLLRRWLEANKPDMAWVADLLDEANVMLGDRNFQIGPSYFMTEVLDDEWLERIWRYSVKPYLEEQFFDEPERVEEFDLERLRARVEPVDESDVAAADEAEAATARSDAARRANETRGAEGRRRAAERAVETRRARQSGESPGEEATGDERPSPPGVDTE